jgi:hypothetical protein
MQRLKKVLVVNVQLRHNIAINLTKRVLINDEDPRHPIRQAPIKLIVQQVILQLLRYIIQLAQVNPILVIHHLHRHDQS